MTDIITAFKAGFFQGDFKDTVSPVERCDFVSVKLEKVHELFQVCRIGGKGVVFYNMAQYGLLYHKNLQLMLNLQFI